MKLYIAILDEFPDQMTPTLVAHSMLGAHLKFCIKEQGAHTYENYDKWLTNSFKKCTLRVNQKEFDKIALLTDTYLGHENTTLNGRKSCAIPLPMPNEKLPNVLRYAKLWKPKEVIL